MMSTLHFCLPGLKITPAWCVLLLLLLAVAGANAAVLNVDMAFKADLRAPNNRDFTIITPTYMREKDEFSAIGLGYGHRRLFQNADWIMQTQRPRRPYRIPVFYRHWHRIDHWTAL
ncbi:hypothetical protein [Pantoea ananatis]|uniref:hypothetical protein n=1 Tax=Pantoea ananas TaxID=553 RepID=UPI0021E87177|nr:hypothetical protein [Pantoea ananatis]MCW0310034.1 hypothetical protein [Pantoea ananatis]MCW0341744.1 hypothetical protein [Pantoea ananatis]MCW0360191.1 hypothetical protein [Pantoea ananatis]MCW0364818.1 hypothetical protein [Pantoea ananatis]MCW1777475.1 hypothetical protein [Pantoea ananatis]